MRIAAVVLAGGASSRFGGNKLAAPLGGRPVLDHALAAVAGITDVVVVVIGPGDPAPAIRGDLGVEVVVARDVVAHQGPLAGLAAGLAALRETGRPIDIALVVAGDMPTLVPDVLRLLVEALAADPTLGVARLESEPVSVLPAAMRPGIAVPAAAALLAADRRSLRGLLDVVPSASISAAEWRALDPDGATLRDVDTPADLRGG